MSDKKQSKIPAKQDFSRISESLAQMGKEHKEKTRPIVQALHDSSPMHLALAEVAQEQKIRMQPIMTAIHRVNMQSLSNGSRRFSELMQNAENTVIRYKEWLQSISEAADAFNAKFKEAIENINRMARPLLAVDKLKATQYVFWEFMTPDFVEDIINSPDVNEMMQAYESKNEYAKSEAILAQCVEHPFVAPQQRLFEQVVASYRNSHYDIAAVGFMAIIDCALSMCSGKSTHNLPHRCEAIMQKIKENAAVSKNEYAEVTLIVTFRAMLDSLDEYFGFPEIPNEDIEPLKLNRHWLMHGRTIKEKTRFDCIKLINLLYGIILIDRILT